MTAAFHGDLGKPRPAVILQADEFLEDYTTVLVCPFTTHLVDSPMLRPTVVPTSGNGLEHISQIMVDKTAPARKAAIGVVIGRLSEVDISRLETALINLTGLRQAILPRLT